MWVADTVVSEEKYQRFTIPTCNPILDVGNPELPVIRELVGIPPTSDVIVSVDIISFNILDDYYIFPAQIPLSDSIYTSQPFQIDPILYSTDEFYPSIIAEISKPEIWRHIRTVKLSAYPITFNPVKKQVKAFYEFIVRLDYSGYGTNPLLNPKSEIPSSYVKMYRSLIINYDYLGLLQEEDFESLLIIVPENYLSEIKPLANWKHQKGVLTVIQTFTAGTADTTEIKNYIISDYNNRETDYVLLVGNTDDLPIYKLYFFQTPNGYSNQRVYSDLWYACITQDILPDLSIGRFSVESGLEISAITDKIYSYKQCISSNWMLDRAVLVAHGDWWGEGYANCKNSIEDTIQTYSSFSVLKLYGEDGATNNDVINAFKNGGGGGA